MCCLSEGGVSCKLSGLLWAQLKLCSCQPAEHLLSHQIRDVLWRSDPPCALLPSSTHGPGQGSRTWKWSWSLSMRQTSVRQRPARQRVKPLLKKKKMPQISAALCPTVKHCSGNDITVCHTFTLAIRFAPPLVAVSVMSPWYARTWAEMEVSHSILTALSLCHDSVCD